MSGRFAILFLAGALTSALAVCPARAAAPAAQPQSTPTISPGWAPQPGTRAWQAAHRAQAATITRPKPAAKPTAISRWSSDGFGLDDEYTARDEDLHRNDLTPGKQAYERTHDASYLDPKSWAVMVYKSRHELDVYYKGRIYCRYHAVFGRSLDHGTKLWEGDRRTPEGVYMIVGRHPSYRWRWFLTLNYPNMVDRERYNDLLQGRVVPVRGGHPVPEGGHIGIHGTDNPLLNNGDINWTTGCISVDNRDISELRRILPIGTVVIIQP